MNEQQNKKENEVTFDISKEALKKRIENLIDSRIDVVLDLHVVLLKYMQILDSVYEDKEFSVYDIERLTGQSHIQAKELIGLLIKSGYVKKVETKPKYKILAYQFNAYERFYEAIIENNYHRVDEFILSACTIMFVENIYNQSNPSLTYGEKTDKAEESDSL